MYRSRTHLVAAACVLAATLAGCGGGDPPVAVVSGHWTRPSLVPGAAFQFTLAQQGTSVTGTGTFSIEAGAAGTLGVTGSAREDGATLVFQYSTGGTATFTGRLTAPDVLAGPFVLSGVNAPAATVEFDRTAP